VHPTDPLRYRKPESDAQIAEARAFYERMRQRRSVREFASDPLPAGLIEELVRAAGTAPSGANLQPWRYVVVTDPALKREIRSAAEAEEREFYEHRAPAEWLADLAPLGTDWHKPFLETAPALVVVFQVDYVNRGGSVHKGYYVRESVGLSVGLFLAAAHLAGLVALTHTPSPMGFLARILGRPPGERPFLLIPVGYPAAGARVPRLERKPLAEILLWNRGGSTSGAAPEPRDGG
jgi:iodotyrosine deiodinase